MERTPSPPNNRLRINCSPARARRLLVLFLCSLETASATFSEAFSSNLAPFVGMPHALDTGVSVGPDGNPDRFDVETKIVPLNDGHVMSIAGPGACAFSDRGLDLPKQASLPTGAEALFVSNHQHQGMPGPKPGIPKSNPDPEGGSPMPMFDFECEDCGKHFEELLFEDDEALPPCPACKSTRVTKLVTMPSPMKKNPFPYKIGPVNQTFVNNAKRAEAMAARGQSPCSSCSSCASQPTAPASAKK